jgi:hypothetical protein
VAGDRALALVESPAQFLHALEYGHARSRALAVVVLAPKRARDVTQLRAMAQLATDQGVLSTWLDPRASVGGAIDALARLIPLRPRLLVVGDPFSGLVQGLLPTMRPRRVVVVDDGSSTIDFAHRVVAGRPLTRWASRQAWPRRAARVPLSWYAGRLLSGRVDLEIFTVMPVGRTPSAGRVTVTDHAYEWTRSHFGPPVVRPSVDVVGSSLVESSVVLAEPYIEAVCQAAGPGGAGGGAGRYFAHRRENPAKLRAIAERSGLCVVQADLPVEVALRQGEVAANVKCFPSSTAFTLPLALQDAPTRVAVIRPDVAWLNPQATGRASGFLEQLTHLVP